VPGSMLTVATSGMAPMICSAVATSSCARRPWAATTSPTMMTPLCSPAAAPTPRPPWAATIRHASTTGSSRALSRIRRRSGVGQPASRQTPGWNDPRSTFCRPV